MKKILIVLLERNWFFINIFNFFLKLSRKIKWTSNPISIISNELYAADVCKVIGLNWFDTKNNQYNGFISLYKLKVI